MRADIAPALLLLAVPLEHLVTHPRNPREGDVGAIAASLAEFGQLKPIVAQRQPRPPHVVVAGNHTLLAARALGWTHLAANVVELDDRRALAYLIADNRSQERGTYDDRLLAELLVEIAQAGDLDPTGYDGDDLDALLRDLSRIEEEPLSPTCPYCGREMEGRR